MFIFLIAKLQKSEVTLNVFFGRRGLQIIIWRQFVLTCQPTYHCNEEILPQWYRWIKLVKPDTNQTRLSLFQRYGINMLHLGSLFMPFSHPFLVMSLWWPIFPTCWCWCPELFSMAHLMFWKLLCTPLLINSFWQRDPLRALQALCGLWLQLSDEGKRKSQENPIFI